MDKLKIAIIVGSLGRGGAERVTLYLANYFKDNDIEPYIITASKRENEYPVPKNIERINLQSSNSFSFFGIIGNLRKIIKKYKFDVVIIMDTPTCMYAIPACIGTDVVKIVSERNDPSHFSGKRITKIISRFLMKYADNYVFQTEAARKYYKKMLKGRGTVIPNPLDTSKIPLRWTGKRKKLIVSVGRLDEQKNQSMMIRAFSSIANDYPDYSLTIYGEGSQRNNLEELIKELNLKDRVFLPGTVSNVASEIKDAYMFVFSSDFEGMPNALIEALAIGLPCISTDCPCGGPAALIKNGENGLLTPVGDESKFATAMKLLLDNKDKANQLGNNATSIKELLSIERVGELWRIFAINVLKEKKGEKK